VACSGTCTWTFTGGMWQVTASNCTGSGCQCVDAIKPPAPSAPRAKFFGPADPALTNSKAISSSGTNLGTATHDLMLYRLNYLVAVFNRNSADEAEFDKNWTPVSGTDKASDLIKKAHLIVATMGAAPASTATANVVLPCR
jgi:hypothetical protein